MKNIFGVFGFTREIMQLKYKKERNNNRNNKMQLKWSKINERKPKGAKEN